MNLLRKSFSKSPLPYLLLLILLGLTLRLPYLLKYQYALNMDEAVFGIMAQDILNGQGIPLFFYGQAYFGPLEALFAIPFFLIFSPTTLILRISVLALTVWGLILFWQGFRFLSQEGRGLIFMAWLVVSPLALTVRSIQPSGHMGGFFCWGLIFYLAVRMIHSPGRPRLDFFLWGLAAGFGLWMHPATLIFVIAGGLVILLHNFRLIRFLPLSFLGCLAGGFPFWIKTVTLRFMTFNFGQKEPSPHFFLSFLKDLGQSILNMDLFLAYDALPKAIFVMTWSCIILLLVSSLFIFVRRRKGRFSSEELLLFFAWLVILLTLVAYSYVRANRHGAVNYRYYLPVLIGLGIIVDVGINRIKQIAPWVGLLIFFFLVLVNLGTNYWGFIERTYLRYEVHFEESYFQWQGLLPQLEPKGIKEAYTDFFEEGPLIFLSGGKIIFSDFYDSRYLNRSLAVDASPNPAFIFRDPKEAELFKQGLSFLGSPGFNSFQTPGHYIFYHIRSPRDVYTPIDRDNILISTFPNHQQSRLLLDGDLSSIWTTEEDQKGTEWVALDLKKTVELSRVDLIPPWLNTYPIHIRIETSLDNRSWTMAADREISNTLFWAGPRPGYKVWEGFFQFIFPGQKARYVRIKQTGTSPMPWELSEIFLYSAHPGKQPRESIDWNSIASFLKREGIKNLVSDLFFSSNIQQYSQGEVRATTRFNGAYPDQRIKDGFTPEQIQALGVHQRDRSEVVAFFNRHRWRCQEQTFGVYSLFHHFITPLSLTRPLDIRDAALTTSHNQKDALSMIDRDRNSRWTSLAPRQAGMYIHCDLKRIQQISALVLDPGPHLQDIANDPDLFYSLDGLHYKKIAQKERFHQHFRWTGSHLIGSGASSAYHFFPVEARYLKIVCQESNSDYYWSVGELGVWGPRGD